MRRLGPTAALLASLALAGCTAGTAIGPGSTVDVYVSMPLRGPAGADGRDVEDGVRMALADAGGKVGSLAVHAVYMDDTSGGGPGAFWSAAQVGRNARRATEDSAAIAYVGDFASGATRTSEPITNQATMLQISPASTAVDLTRPVPGSNELSDLEHGSGERTFGRVIPDDDSQGRAAADWVRQLGVKRVEIEANGAYGRSLAAGFRAAFLGEISLRGKGPALLYEATSGPESQSIGQSFPGRILGSDALLPPLWTGSTPPLAHLITSAAQDPSQLPAAGRRFVAAFRRQFGHSPGRYAAYGYESMAVVLDSIRRAGENGADRQSVIDQFFHTTDRASVLGTYSIDSLGDTTLSRLTGYRLAAGRLVPAFRLTSR